LQKEINAELKGPTAAETMMTDAPGCVAESGGGMNLRLENKSLPAVFPSGEFRCDEPLLHPLTPVAIEPNRPASVQGGS